MNLRLQRSSFPSFPSLPNFRLWNTNCPGNSVARTPAAKQSFARKPLFKRSSTTRGIYVRIDIRQNARAVNPLLDAFAALGGLTPDHRLDGAQRIPFQPIVHVDEGRA